MAPLYREMKKAEGLRPVLLSTGQHREMLAQTLGAFGLTPDFDLGLMQPNQTLASLTSRAITSLSEYFAEHKPHVVLVQGDTTSVLAASIAAFYQRIPIGHVEAGLRTGDIQSPFPEEMNRRLTTPLCKFNFAPTEWSKANLIREGIPESSIHVTGNTVIDALHWMKSIVSERSNLIADLSARLRISSEFRKRYLESSDQRMILVTAHRRESHGQGMENLCDALLRISRGFPDVGILFPVHLNPIVRGTVLPRLSQCERIELIDPVGYEDFVWLIDRSYMLISDSGGIQEEAPSFGKPVLVTRESTERPEGVSAGTCRLVGTDQDLIVREACELLEDTASYRLRSQLKNPYGDGMASQRICDILRSNFP
jgi:UDP-N-acetylglucosamine 2-epimerase (non-hydrolysing)